MSDQPDSVMLALLEGIDAKLDRILADIRDMKRRMTRMEVQLSTLAANRAIQHATLSVRMDRLEDRQDRIGRRSDTTE